MNDIKIKCQDCEKDFIFTEKDQIFYNEKGFYPPKRCKTCRNIRKNEYYHNQGQR